MFYSFICSICLFLLSSEVSVVSVFSVAKKNRPEFERFYVYMQYCFTIFSWLSVALSSFLCG